MKMLCALFLLLSGGIVSAASLSFNWSTEISDARPYSAQAFQGETFALKATMLQYAAPLAITATATFYYQTPEMPSTQWYTSDAHYDSATATVSTTFTPAMDVGAPSYRFFFGIDDAAGKNYRVYGTIRLRPSPGFTPSTIVPSDVKQELIDAITADVQAYVRSRYTPLTAHQELANLLSSHSSAKNNPHSVTAAQLGALTAEADPTVSAWAKAANKPTYTASEVGAAAASHTHKVANISDFPTSWAWGSVSGIPSWIGSTKPTYTAVEVGAPTVNQLDALSASLNSHASAKNNPHGVTAAQLGALTSESDPTISAWAKAASKPTYTAAEVGAYTTAKADELINASSSLARFLMASTPGATTQNWQYDVRPSALGGVHPLSSTISVKGSASGTVSTTVESDGVSPVASLTAVPEGAQIVAYSGWHTSPTLAHAGIVKAKANAQDNSEISSVELRADRDGTVRVRMFSKTNPARIKDPSAFDDSDLISKGAANSLARDAASIEVMRHATNRNNPHGVTAAQLGALTSETDPSVSAWAKAANKPAYTAAEVGALSSESDPSVSAWAKAANKPTYTASEVGALSSESDPTISAWAKAANKPAYTAAEVGALSSESDPSVSAWAKAAAKPTYTAAEVGAAAFSSTSMVTNGVTYVWTWSESEGTFVLHNK